MTCYLSLLEMLFAVEAIAVVPRAHLVGVSSRALTTQSAKGNEVRRLSRRGV